LKEKNRLIKVCYAPVTSVTYSKFFLLWPFTVLTRQTSQAVHAIKQFISLDVYGLFVLGMLKQLSCLS
jgi:hypothetical protein